MKPKWGLFAALLLILCACGHKTVNLLSIEGIEIKGNNSSLVETRDGAVFLKNQADGNNGFAIYNPVKDWTPYKALRWSVENKSDKPLSLWVRVFNPGINGKCYKKGSPPA